MTPRKFYSLSDDARIDHIAEQQEAIEQEKIEKSHETDALGDSRMLSRDRLVQV